MKTNKPNQIIKIFTLITLFQYPTISLAFPKTDADFAQLPEFCRARDGRTTESITKLWHSKIGRRTWTHLHHYCSGIDSVNKANKIYGSSRKDLDNKSRLLNNSIGGFNYIVENVPTSILAPSAHLKIGEVLIRLGQSANGINEMQKSIKINPKFTQGYLSLSKTFEKQGLHDDAIRIIQQGLKNKPKSKKLKRQLKKLKSIK